ncbi:MAG: prepilin-type N-terminal cleavage/methylation domain-containing protein [Proteobacteria bacterium]|nr:prepilin-type N-terminal cleavage/methylation domain-containing protein [Pseudomonadota bacterium]
MTKQSGFTLVEIAIVLVIIGLLLGGILKGQELINSARVRNLADQNTGIQAAYYGFIDRYRQVPGDFLAANATTAIGVTVNLPSTVGLAGNGRIDNNVEEAAAVWEQLAKSNFIGGGFTPAGGIPADEIAYKLNAPINAFNGSLTLTRNSDFTGTNPVRLVLHLGTNIPVKISRELDLKVDDGMPTTGVLRLSAPSAPWVELHAIDTGAPLCTDTATPPNYNIAGDAQNCGLAFLY